MNRRNLLVVSMITAMGCATAPARPAAPPSVVSPEATAEGMGGAESPSVTADAAASPEPANVSFQVVRQQGAAETPVPPGATLKSGERIAMRLGSSTPVYVYVLQFFPDGSAAVLFPEPGEVNRVPRAMRIPASGWFELDDVVGEENVYIVASKRPLREADESVRDTVAHVRTTNSIPPDAKLAIEKLAAESAAAGGSGDSGFASNSAKRDDDGAGAAGDHRSKGEPAARRRRPKHRPTRRRKAVGSPRLADPPRASLLSRGLSRVSDDREGIRVELETDDDGLAVYLFTLQHAPR